jgi:hypothetical protein
MKSGDRSSSRRKAGAVRRTEQAMTTRDADAKLRPDLAEILGQLTNLIQNERVAAYNQGFDAGLADRPSTADLEAENKRLIEALLLARSVCARVESYFSDREAMRALVAIDEALAQHRSETAEGDK